jgi:hypothetical protein
MLLTNGANEVFIDNGSIAEEVRKRHPEGFSKILELVRNLSNPFPQLNVPQVLEHSGHFPSIVPRVMEH